MTVEVRCAVCNAHIESVLFAKRGERLCKPCTKSWSDCAGLVKSHLWKRKTPPPSADSNPWHMGRERSIWIRLRGCGWKTEELEGAISVLNTVEPYDGPRRLTVFYGTRVDPDNPERIVWTGTATLERCVGKWHKDREFQRPKGPKMGGKVEISIQVQG